MASADLGAQTVMREPPVIEAARMVLELAASAEGSFEVMLRVTSSGASASSSGLAGSA